MSDEEKIVEIFALLRHVPSDIEYCENVMDYSGGNFDDAYSMGIDFGASELANDIKNILEKE